MDDELKHKLRYIRFNGLFGNWDRWLEVARKGNFSHTRLLKYVIEEEHKLKKENSRKMRLKRAKIPEMLVMETFPFRRQPKLSRKPRHLRRLRLHVETPERDLDRAYGHGENRSCHSLSYSSDRARL